jgi:hypothetical protein
MVRSELGLRERRWDEAALRRVAAVRKRKQEEIRAEKNKRGGRAVLTMRVRRGDSVRCRPEITVGEGGGGRSVASSMMPTRPTIANQPLKWVWRNSSRPLAVEMVRSHRRSSSRRRAGAG